MTTNTDVQAFKPDRLRWLPKLSASAVGLMYGFLAIASFSLSLPATRIAVAEIDPIAVGLGRGLVASILAALVLVARRQKKPTRRQFSSLAIVAAGVVIGFPLLSAWAMRRLPASHGAVLLGLTPLLTAIAGAIRTGERPSRPFWIASVAGSSAVVAFAVYSGAGNFDPADLVLGLGLVAGAVGYAEGGKLARDMGGWQVISWAVVISGPFLAIPALMAFARTGPGVSSAAWVGFGYVCVVSQYIGFFAWYHALAVGGVSRVSQVQLLQPFMTFVASAVLLGEHITWPMVATATVVVAAVAVVARARIPVIEKRSKPKENRYT